MIDCMDSFVLHVSPNKDRSLLMLCLSWLVLVDNDEASRGPQAQATPESNLPGGEDALIFPASHSSIRAFNRVHGNKSQLDKAHEIFRAVQRLKERVGIGLDPGGCQLATPERNERVSDEEEVYELHPESETESAGTSELKI